ncbi:MAG TPA: ABC transporter permease [Candidatus Nitrosopolaris sp.]|nr:ABC transporter permease [Candidatus Nitrosopolaris sp.]
MHISKMSPVTNPIRVIWAMALKDIQSSLTERAFMLTSIIIPINFLLLFLLFALTGGLAPTAIVLKENGPYAQQLVSAMEHSHSFIIRQTTASDAQNLMQKGQIVAIVTVPANFDSALNLGEQIELPVVVNNLDVDFTNDIRRAMPLAITSFYANAFPNLVVVKVHEFDTYPQDTGYVQYLVVSLMVVSVMLGGLLQAGSNAAREYEKGTIKELMLAPASPWAIQVGKILGALILNSLPVVVVIIVIVFLIGVLPVHWDELLGYVLLLMMTFVAAGALIGTLVRRRQAVIPLSIGLSVPVFFISGAFGPAIWGDPITAAVAQLQPVYYGIAVFQHAFHNFVTTSTGPRVDGIILVGFAAVMVALSAIALGSSRGRGVAH